MRTEFSVDGRAAGRHNGNVMARVRFLALQICRFLSWLCIFLLVGLPLIIVLLPEMLSEYWRGKSVQCSRGRVRRLAERASLRHSGASERQRERGLRAWERLIRMGDRQGRAWPRWLAQYQVWESWLSAPDDEGWAVLTRWKRGAAPDHLFKMLDRQQDMGNRAALEAFCVRHELAPAWPAERVRFYLLTGQHERRRALDPDDALLAAAYWVTPVPKRERLRKALLASEDLVAMRAIAGGWRNSPRTPGALRTWASR